MTTGQTTPEFAPGESFQRHLARLAAAPVLERVAGLSQEALADYDSLLDEYRRTADPEDKQEILQAMLEIVLDEPVATIPVDQVEADAGDTLEGAAAAERLSRQARALGANLKRLRSRLRMTQKQLAVAAHMTQPQISYLERGEHRPQEATLNRLAEVLGVSPDELIVSD